MLHHYRYICSSTIYYIYVVKSFQGQCRNSSKIATKRNAKEDEEEKTMLRKREKKTLRN